MLLARLLLVATTANAWQRWEYKADATQQWKELWGLERGPGARRGHSLVLHHKPATDTEKLFSIMTELAGGMIFGILAGTLSAMLTEAGAAAAEVEAELDSQLD